MTEMCRMIPYQQKTTLKKRLKIWWYNLKHGRLVWRREETLMRGVNKGDPLFDTAPVSYNLIWHPKAFEMINIGPEPKQDK